MFLVGSGSPSERLVAKTVLFEAYFLANSAPRPREAPMMRMFGMFAKLELSECRVEWSAINHLGRK